MKQFLSVVFTCSILGCSTQRISCDAVGKQLNTELKEFYALQNDSLNLSPIEKKWNFLLQEFCKKTSSSTNGLIMLESAKHYGDQKGLLYLIDKNEIS